MLHNIAAKGVKKNLGRDFGAGENRSNSLGVDFLCISLVHKKNLIELEMD